MQDTNMMIRSKSGYQLQGQHMCACNIIIVTRSRDPEGIRLREGGCYLIFKNLRINTSPKYYIASRGTWYGMVLV